MIQLYPGGVYLVNGAQIVPEGPEASAQIRQAGGVEG